MNQSAFPILFNDGGRALRAEAGGMTLRDYFAAKAMNSMTPEQWPTRGDCEEIAKRSYLMADAMLKAREA